jgi:hypothetical protein
MGGEHTTGICIEHARVFARRLRGAFPRYRTTLLAARHSVPIPPARTAAISAAAVAAALLEAIRAVHGLVASRLEWDLRFFAAAGARRAEHLALTAPARTVPAAIRGGGSVAAVRAAITLRLAGSPAIRATSGLRESAAGVEILLAAGKRKGLAAIAAGQGGVGRHRDGSLRV